jgi:hypothetical protein
MIIFMPLRKKYAGRNHINAYRVLKNGGVINKRKPILVAHGLFANMPKGNSNG